MARWRQDGSGRVEHPFEPVVLVATLAMIPVVIIERDAKSHQWRTLAFAANWVICPPAFRNDARTVDE